MGGSGRQWEGFSFLTLHPLFRLKGSGSSSSLTWVLHHSRACNGWDGHSHLLGKNKSAEGLGHFSQVCSLQKNSFDRLEESLCKMSNDLPFDVNNIGKDPLQNKLQVKKPRRTLQRAHKQDEKKITHIDRQPGKGSSTQRSTSADHLDLIPKQRTDYSLDRALAALGSYAALLHLLVVVWLWCGF